MRDDLYEQCSFYIAEKMPSSVKVGTRTISFRMRSYSSGFRPCEATRSGVICGSFLIIRSGRSEAFSPPGKALTARGRGQSQGSFRDKSHPKMAPLRAAAAPPMRGSEAFSGELV